MTVQPGDTLSEIAADHGVTDWTTVWPANAGRDEPDGDRFTDPDHIEPGWTVTIPPTSRDVPTTGDNAGDNTVQVIGGGHVVAARGRQPGAARRQWSRPTSVGSNPTDPGSPTRMTSGPGGAS